VVYRLDGLDLISLTGTMRPSPDDLLFIAMLFAIILLRFQTTREEVWLSEPHKPDAALLRRPKQLKE
jgi:hypothetical protein